MLLLFFPCISHSPYRFNRVLYFPCGQFLAYLSDMLFDYLTVSLSFKSPYSLINSLFIKNLARMKGKQFDNLKLCF